MESEVKHFWLSVLGGNIDKRYFSIGKIGELPDLGEHGIYPGTCTSSQREKGDNTLEPFQFQPQNIIHPRCLWTRVFFIPLHAPLVVSFRG